MLIRPTATVIICWLIVRLIVIPLAKKPSSPFFGHLGAYIKQKHIWYLWTCYSADTVCALLNLWEFNFYLRVAKSFGTSVHFVLVISPSKDKNLLVQLPSPNQIDFFYQMMLHIKSKEDLKLIVR